MSAPGNLRNVRPDGLLGCCLATLRQHTQLTDVGSVLQCPYSWHVMVVWEDGIWQVDNE